MDYVTYFKGGIWKYDMTKYRKRGILEGVHPVVIISKVSNPTRPCQVLVCPISHMSTSSNKQDVEDVYNSVCIELEQNKKSYVCVNQIFPAITSDLYNYKGQITGAKLKEIDKAIASYLQLDLSENVQITDCKNKQIIPKSNLAIIEPNEHKQQDNSDTSSDITNLSEEDTIKTEKVTPTLTECLITLTSGSVKLGKFLITKPSRSSQFLLDTTNDVIYNSNRAVSIAFKIHESSVCKNIKSNRPISGHTFIKLDKNTIDKIEEVQ